MTYPNEVIAIVPDAAKLHPYRVLEMIYGKVPVHVIGEITAQLPEPHGKVPIHVAIGFLQNKLDFYSKLDHDGVEENMAYWHEDFQNS